MTWLEGLAGWSGGPAGPLGGPVCPVGRGGRVARLPRLAQWPSGLVAWCADSRGLKTMGPKICQEILSKSFGGHLRAHVIEVSFRRVPWALSFQQLRNGSLRGEFCRTCGSSELQMHCWVQIPWGILRSLVVVVDSTDPPLLKPTFDPFWVTCTLTAQSYFRVTFGSLYLFWHCGVFRWITTPWDSMRRGPLSITLFSLRFC